LCIWAAKTEGAANVGRHPTRRLQHYPVHADLTPCRPASATSPPTPRRPAAGPRMRLRLMPGRGDFNGSLPPGCRRYPLPTVDHVDVEWKSMSPRSAVYGKAISVTWVA